MIFLKNVKKSYTKDSYHSVAPEETIKIATRKLKHFWHGAFYGLQEIGSFDTIGLPVYRVSCLRNYNEWGKGITIEQSKASAVMERVERISSAAPFRDKIDAVKSTFNQLNQDAFSRKDFGLLNMHYVLYGEDKIDDIEMDWVKSQSLINDKNYSVPAQEVYLNHSNPKFADSLCSNGLASGNTIEEAIVQAVCEVIERHIFHKIYFNFPKVKQIDLQTVENPELKRVIEQLKSMGFEIIANDLSDNWKLSTVSTFIYHPKEQVIFNSYLKVGTSTDPEIAIIRAITEFAQNRAVFIHRANYKKDAEGFFHGASEGVLEQYKWATEDDNMVSIKDITNISKNDFKEEIEIIIKDAKEKGYDLLVYDLTHSKINIPVVRVMVPGLQPNFLVRGLHYLDKKACVTKHLKIYEEVMEKIKKRQLLNQKLDDVVEL